jgi:hypothetical protein
MDAYETYVEMCHKCDLTEHRRLTKIVSKDEIVTLFDGVWKIFDRMFLEHNFSSFSDNVKLN